jgi:hypothetical protein
MHEVALYGATRAFLGTIARSITRQTQPMVKLH